MNKLSVRLIVLKATALLGMLSSTQALAFQPHINIGGGSFLFAPRECADLAIEKGDTLLIDTGYSRFTLQKWPQGAPQPVTLLTFVAPDEGNYFFEGPKELQYSHDFQTESFDGSEGYDFEGQDGTGNVTITHWKPGAATTVCNVNPVPFGPVDPRLAAAARTESDKNAP